MRLPHALRPARPPLPLSPSTRLAPWQPPGPRRPSAGYSQCGGVCGDAQRGPERPQSAARAVDAAGGAGRWTAEARGCTGPAAAPGYPRQRPEPQAQAQGERQAGGRHRQGSARMAPARSPPGAGDCGSGGAHGLHGGARGGIQGRPRPVCLCDARSALGPGGVLGPRPPARALSLQCGPPPAPPPPRAAGRGGTGRDVLRFRPLRHRVGGRWRSQAPPAPPCRARQGKGTRAVVSRGSVPRSLMWLLRGAGAMGGAS